MSKRPGVTLIELLVVLLVMALATALVVPSLVAPEPSARMPVDDLLARVVEMATAREERLELVVPGDGHWHLYAAETRESLADGSWPGAPARPFVLQVSSLGTCGPEPGLSLPFDVDPLTCRVR